MSFLPEPKFQHGTISRTGILLINLGTPVAPTATAVKPYLKQFLSDPRVVEIPRLVWWPILNGIILNTRPKQSAAKYAKIWTRDGSPLKVHTEKQAMLLRGYLGERVKTPHSVAWSMRYGEPSVATALAELRSQGCDRVLVLPLYPQYAASTTASAYDAVFDAVKKMRNAPALRLVKHYHDHPGYIAALAKNVNDYWMVNGRPDKLVMSFHGVPRFSLDRGDPYHCECHVTGAVAGPGTGTQAGATRSDFPVALRSRRVAQAIHHRHHPNAGQAQDFSGGRGVPGIRFRLPGNTGGDRHREQGRLPQGGGGDFHYIPCLNQRHEWIQALSRIAAENLHGWASTDWDQAPAQRAAAESRTRAIAMGAKS